MKYTYYSSDTFTGEGDFDITGNHYQELLNLCFQYSAVMSFLIYDSNASYLKELEKFKIKRPQNITGSFEEHRETGESVQPYYQYYQVCEELKMLMFTISDSLFPFVHAWGYTNPEDPTFYRADGSVFFYSIVHEGECSFLPRDNEDISQILSMGHWVVDSYPYDGKPGYYYQNK